MTYCMLYRLASIESDPIDSRRPGMGHGKA